MASLQYETTALIIFSTLASGGAAYATRGHPFLAIPAFFLSLAIIIWIGLIAMSNHPALRTWVLRSPKRRRAQIAGAFVLLHVPTFLLAYLLPGHSVLWPLFFVSPWMTVCLLERWAEQRIQEVRADFRARETGD